MSFDRALERAYSLKNGSGRLLMVKIVENRWIWMRNGRKDSKLSGDFCKTLTGVQRRSTVARVA